MSPVAVGASTGHAGHGSRVNRSYGHRVLIASLFLPDTLTFHERDDSVIQTPNDQSSVPPSPTADISAAVPAQELDSRLAGVSAAFRSGPALEPPEDGTASAVSDADGPPLPPLSARPHKPSTSTTASKGPSPQPPQRRPSASHGQATGGESSDRQNPINMSQLMAEATRPPNFDDFQPPPAPKSNSASGSSRPTGLTALTPSHPTQTSSVADHGRSGDEGNQSQSGGPPSRPLPSKSPAAGFPPTTTSISLTAPQPPSRRGSMTTGQTSPFRSGQTPSAAPSSSSSSLSTKKTPDAAGTRTPGGQVAGRAGTMQPLSIIDDLQARQHQPNSLQLPAPTPGDAERHHPFGGGAVTPLRGTQTPGHTTKTPNLGPKTPGGGAGSQTPGTNKAFQSAVTGRSHPFGLSMTKANEGLAARRSGAATGGSSTPHPEKAAAEESQASGKTLTLPGPSRPPLSRVGSKTTSASVGGTYNDHGRGADTIPAGADDDRMSAHATGKETKKVTLQDGETDDSGSVSGSATSPSHSHRGRLPHGGRHARLGSATGHYMSSLSARNRPQSKSRISSRRSCNHVLMSGKARRSSADTLSTFAEDIGPLDDESPGFGGPGSMGASTPAEELPPFDFVSNPSSNGGMVNAISALNDQRKLRGPGGSRIFIGTPSIHADEDWLSSRHRRSIANRYRHERSSLPVWVESDVFRAAYTNFCKGILWPTFHYTLPSDKALENEHEAFEAYRELNMSFARKIAEEWREGDIVLINDYHLLLVPLMLRELVPSATIGLFVHIAFPSSELFRCLVMRETLLRGMLGADLVGFQTHNFCRHFRQTVSRILQLEATPKGVQTESFFTTVSSFPIGIDPRNLNAKRSDPDVAEWVTKLAERYEGKKVIVGRDKLDWIRGVRQKLLAFEVFLNEHPEWVGKVVLIQVALATNEDNEEAGEANDVVSRINSRYSSLTYQPVVFLHVQDITFSQYLALLTVADGFMANSLREGMNLTTHEYIICQEEKQSPLILSEFTGTYSALRACIGINPWNTQQVAHAIHKALTMSEEEQRARWADLHRTVVTQTALQWITSLLSRLERAHVEQQRRDNAFIPKLEVGQIVSEWRASKTRLVIFDLEGCLLPESVMFLRSAEELHIPDKVLQSLRELTDDPQNEIYVLSSLSSDYLDKIAEKLPQLGIVAEDGCAVKHPYQSSWMSLTAGLSNSWKSSVTQILRYFQARTPGSFLHDRGSTLFFSTGADERQQQEEQSKVEGHGDRSNLETPPKSDDSAQVGNVVPKWASHGTGVAHGLYSQESQWARRQLAEINNLVYDSLGLSLRIIPRGTTLTVMPKNVSRTSAVQHVVQLQAMGMLGQMRAEAAAVAWATRSDGSASGPGTSKSGPPKPLKTPEVETESFATSSAQLCPTYSGHELHRYSIGKGEANPWDHWTPHSHSHSGRAQPSSGSKSSYMFSVNGTHTHHSMNAPEGSTNHGTPRKNSHHLSHVGGNFDFSLYIGRDEKIMSYLSSLDLPFSPLTVTTASDVDTRGSEAGFSLEEEDVADAMAELTSFRRRDARWGRSTGVD